MLKTIDDEVEGGALMMMRRRRRRRMMNEMIKNCIGVTRLLSPTTG